jgi:hypothetical protein
VWGTLQAHKPLVPLLRDSTLAYSGDLEFAVVGEIVLVKTVG